MSAERIVHFHPLLISNAVVLYYSNVDYDNNVDYDTCKKYVLQIMLMSEHWLFWDRTVPETNEIFKK